MLIIFSPVVLWKSKPGKNIMLNIVIIFEVQ